MLASMVQRHVLGQVPPAATPPPQAALACNVATATANGLVRSNGAAQMVLETAKTAMAWMAPPNAPPRLMKMALVWMAPPDLTVQLTKIGMAWMAEARTTMLLVHRSQPWTGSLLAAVLAPEVQGPHEGLRRQSSAAAQCQIVIGPTGALQSTADPAEAAASTALAAQVSLYAGSPPATLKSFCPRLGPLTPHPSAQHCCQSALIALTKRMPQSRTAESGYSVVPSMVSHCAACKCQQHVLPRSAHLALRLESLAAPLSLAWVLLTCHWQLALALVVAAVSSSALRQALAAVAASASNVQS